MSLVFESFVKTRSELRSIVSASRRQLEVCERFLGRIPEEADCSRCSHWTFPGADTLRGTFCDLGLIATQGDACCQFKEKEETP